MTLPSALRRLPLRRLVCLVFLLLVAAWVAGNWPVILSGLDELRGADRNWLLAAVVLTGACWIPVCLLRQGTVMERLPAGRLFASQVAAGSANHLLPAGLGAHMVTLRFLQRCGLSTARSVAALALYSLAQPVGRYTLLLTLMAACPGAIPLGGLLPAEYGMLALLLLIGGLTLVALALWSVRPLRGFVQDFLRTALTDARALHARPSRAIALWTGALAFPALQACVMVTVTRALQMPVPTVDVMIAYLAAGIVAGIVPTPGGIGSVEAALLVALVGAGSPVHVATAAVLGFRLVTVWLPLLPGALVLAVLVRRKVL
ncbi:lysylphosphatidylglycerol synthase domain-containing protein [Streptomyces sp. NBC_01498]|uniref:lysylphosphatidylglycerol synthase transmembrane domain-containing protein n=1 Tax=Streptomyces sp. NBC_01498 TaxID=2975870 RepID=UPI002E7B3229|nr:YbhN family protein [Streptomyces sp. NBC_01498]WTL28692.1 lysylphosphatidylglycerol synthase domain-containing protein [Streptomyces sp. NBC_01498]